MCCIELTAKRVQTQNCKKQQMYDKKAVRAVMYAPEVVARQDAINKIKKTGSACIAVNIPPSTSGVSTMSIGVVCNPTPPSTPVTSEPHPPLPNLGYSSVRLQDLLGRQPELATCVNTKGSLCVVVTHTTECCPGETCTKLIEFEPAQYPVLTKSQFDTRNRRLGLTAVKQSPAPPMTSTLSELLRNPVASFSIPTKLEGEGEGMNIDNAEVQSCFAI